MNHTNRFSEEKEQEIIDMYLSGMNQVEIANHFKTFNTSIRRVLLRKNISIISGTERVRKLIPTFFNDYTNTDIQYWLGVIASDGCITNGKLILETIDKEWMEDYRNFINPLININTTQPKKGKLLYRISTGCVGLQEQLEKYGIIPDKSLLLKWLYPLTRDFVRGVFDGDGCATFANREKSIKISICGGSLVFLEQIKKFLLENNIESTITSSIRKRKNRIYYLNINAHSEKIKFYNLLYDNSNFFLKRKKEKFSRVFEKINIRKVKIKVILIENSNKMPFPSITHLGNYLKIDHRKLSYWLKNNCVPKQYNIKYAD